MGLFIKFMACFSVFVVMFGHSSQALTTFGKTNTNQAPTPPPLPPVIARQCKLEGDCAGIQDTSCVRDSDGQTKCLCGDNAPPVNGACATKLKGLRHACGDNAQCMEEMICLAANATQEGTPKIVITTGAAKVCVCNKEEGFIEIDHDCSGSPQSTAGLLALMSVIISLTIFQ